MKITGASKDAQQFVDGLEPRTAVGKLDVGQDQPRPLLLGQRHSLGVSARNAEHAMTQPLHKGLELHRDEGIILDDQHVGRDFGRQLAAGFLDQIRAASSRRCRARARHRGSGKPSSATSRKAWRGNGVMLASFCSPGSGAFRRARRAVDGERVPDLREQAIERDPGPLGSSITVRSAIKASSVAAT